MSAADLSPGSFLKGLTEAFAKCPSLDDRWNIRREEVSSARLADTRNTLLQDLRDHAPGSEAEELEYHADKAVHLATILHLAGASETECMRWFGFAAVSWFLAGDHDRARCYAIVAGQDELLSLLQEFAPANNSDVAQQVLAQLCGVKVAAPKASSPDEYTAALLALRESIPAVDQRAINDSLMVLGEFWSEMAQYLDDPNPHIYPQFEPAITALARLAVKSGFDPGELSAEVRLLLEPAFYTEPEPTVVQDQKVRWTD